MCTDGRGDKKHMYQLNNESSGLGPFQWNTFLDTPPDDADYENAKFVVLPIPFDSTTSYRPGTRDGPAAIITASAQMEDYDIEIGIDASQSGIHTAPELIPDLSSTKAFINQVERLTNQVSSDGKIPVLLGGEHTITLGSVTALANRFADFAVLYFDAHGDMRNKYMGTKIGHASVARRLLEICPVVHAGVRTLSFEEAKFIEDQKLNTQFWPAKRHLDEYTQCIIDSLPETIYISIDLDVLDPSIMAAVGTPEPGGMLWHELITILRRVCSERDVVGFDVVELSPGEGPESCAYTAAKLVYKLIGYVSTLCPV